MKLFESPDAPKLAAADRERLDAAFASAIADGHVIGAWTREMFFDPELVPNLPASIREHPAVLKDYLVNTSRFAESLQAARMLRYEGDASGLLGEVVQAPDVAHEDGRARDADTGNAIRLEHLRKTGIDPAKVLYFRVTQPSETPKPEYYWTSDFFETLRGLNAEISEAKRKSAVILVADLETVHGEGGLIQDRNDDHGLPVRQLDVAPFDQKKALAKIHPHRP